MEITLKEITFSNWLAVLVILVLTFTTLTFELINLKPERAYVGGICPDNIKEAMQKMGPHYDYKTIGESLYVNKGDEKWLKLNYEREVLR